MIQLIPSKEVVSTSLFKEITKAYKYEMKPTKNQEVKLNQTLSTCRHLYNDSLAERKNGYENGGWNVHYNDQQNYLPTLRNKNDETGKYLKEVQTQVLQNVLKRVDFAYQNFFRRVKNNKTDTNNGKKDKVGFPRFKGYGRYDSFTFPQYGNGADIRIYKNNNDLNNKKQHIVRLSKIGEIKYISHREIGEFKNKITGKIEKIPYQIKTITIKKEVDKWFLVATVDTFVEIQSPIITIEELNNKSIGIDMGLSNLATLSNGKKIEPPEYLRESAKKLAKEQRNLSRKKKYEKIIEINKNVKTAKAVMSKGEKIDKEIEKKKIKINSKNREKQIIKVKKIHRKIVNQRRNFNHEASRTLINNFDLIAFEKLSIQNMVKNHRLAKSISDASWYQLQMFTKYKAEWKQLSQLKLISWAGKIVDFVDPKYTSQNCSNPMCGKLVGRVTEGDMFICPFCNLKINVHVNAANNIRDRSIEYQKLIKDIEFTPAIGGGACGE